MYVATNSVNTNNCVAMQYQSSSSETNLLKTTNKCYFEPALVKK